MKTSEKILLGLGLGVLASCAAVSVYKTIQANKEAKKCDDRCCCSGDDCGDECCCECTCENCNCEKDNGNDYIDVEQIPHEECCCCCHCESEEKPTEEEKAEEATEENKDAE